MSLDFSGTCLGDPLLEYSNFTLAKYISHYGNTPFIDKNVYLLLIRIHKYM